MSFCCPNCDEDKNIDTERRPNGNSWCNACKYEGPTITFNSNISKGESMSEEKKIFEGDTEAGLDYDPKECMKCPGPKAPPHSMNGRFILETYKEDRALKATVSNGFAMVQQKVSLKGLTILADVFSPTTGQYIARKGDKAFIREASLQSQPWAKASFTSDAIEGEFMIVEMTYIEFIDHK